MGLVMDMSIFLFLSFFFLTISLMHLVLFPCSLVLFCVSLRYDILEAFIAGGCDVNIPLGPEFFDSSVDKCYCRLFLFPSNCYNRHSTGFTLTTWNRNTNFLLYFLVLVMH